MTGSASASPIIIDFANNALHECTATLLAVLAAPRPFRPSAIERLDEVAERAARAQGSARTW